MASTVQEMFVNLINADATSAWVGIVLTTLGGLVVLGKIVSACSFLFQHFVRPGISPKKFGPWAIVTGATDGIGKAYCQALAKKGMLCV